MNQPTLNLGILAHVDAGKTTLTERLLYDAGVLTRLGTVDSGTTQTDSLALERQRGITIRAAVASLPVDGATVNIVDTPGHPDFIAEVERSLAVLDGAVLVVSAVEGVQPQTRILMRALQRLQVPTVLFVNKVDRGGADPERVVAEMTRRLSAALVPMTQVRHAGSAAASVRARGDGDADFRDQLIDVLAGHDEDLLARYVENERNLTAARLRRELEVQTRRALVHPVYFGSAMTGAGVDVLRAGLVPLLGTATGDSDGPVSGRVFKIERGQRGEKVAYLRLFSGSVRVRDRLSTRGDDRVTALHTFQGGAWLPAAELAAGEIGKVWGLVHAKVGDVVGTDSAQHEHRFAPPTLESVVTPVCGKDGALLRSALDELAEQDPLIDVRQDDARREISVSLYGEVQKEVLQATLADEYGVAVEFHASSVLCVERPLGVGRAVERLHGTGNPFHATIGLRVEPGPAGSGPRFRVAVDPRDMPMYVYKGMDGFVDAMSAYVVEALQEGLAGWPVTDCVVTLDEVAYSVADGPPSRRGPTSTAADFRKLTPIVVMEALAAAGTVVCEPTLRVRIEAPAASVGPVHSAVARLGGAVDTRQVGEDLAVLETALPAATVQTLQRQLPGLTGGEALLETEFAGYQPVRGAVLSRRRSGPDPLNRHAYLHAVGAPVH